MNASYDVHDGKVSETFSSVRFKGDNYYVGAGKNFRRSTSLDQYTFEAGFTGPMKFGETVLPLSLSGILWYDVDGNGVQELNINASYTRQCWGFSINYNKKPREYQVIIAIEFKGLGAFRVGHI